LKEQRDALMAANDNIRNSNSELNGSINALMALNEQLLHHNAEMELRLYRWRLQPRNEKGQFIKIDSNE
jgi:hypothetical protein